MTASVGTSAPDGEVRTLSGWGGRPRSTARVSRPEDLADLERALDGVTFVPRGLGRSYGDAAQLSGGTVVETTALTGIRVDDRSGRVTAGAGASLGEIVDLAVPRGWFIPVTPGTRHVTVGGAVAADVHGKNHHRDGSFGSYVEEIRLLTAAGEEVRALPGHPAFSATVGGMGLTGVVLEATFRLIPVESAWMRVDVVRCDDLSSLMEALADADRRSRYSVAWTDLAPGRRGRGVLMAGDHAAADGLPRRLRSRPLRRPPLREAPAPPLPAGLVGASAGTFNRLWFARFPDRETGTLQSLDGFFYPLDRLGKWNRLYGPAGFLQYQFVVPAGAGGTLAAVAEILSRSSTPVSLAVLKRFGPGRSGPLAFPMEGWTLSADMPLGDPALGATLDSCDRLVADAGGRVYLAKDSRTRPELMPAMYPRLDEWREVKAGLDPRGRVRSDLSDRLGLT